MGDCCDIQLASARVPQEMHENTHTCMNVYRYMVSTHTETHNINFPITPEVLLAVSHTVTQWGGGGGNLSRELREMMNNELSVCGFDRGKETHLNDKWQLIVKMALICQSWEKEERNNNPVLLIWVSQNNVTFRFMCVSVYFLVFRKWSLCDNRFFKWQETLCNVCRLIYQEHANVPVGGTIIMCETKLTMHAKVRESCFSF